MKQKIRLFPSGISLVDNTWGGFYKGGTYLLIGPHKSGRTLLGLQFARQTAKQKETCLYFTHMRPKELLIHAASIDFDLQHFMNQNNVVVVRVTPPVEINNNSGEDDVYVEYINDIIAVVEQYQPDKIVFDELTPFIGFSSLKLLQNIFLQMTERIEEAGITSLFILGEPATMAARNIVDTLAGLSTGAIFIEKDDEETKQGGVIKIIPNIGHTEGQFESRYRIEPYKGTTFEYEVTQKKQPELKEKKEVRYKTLADIELPEETYSVTNIYTTDDFNLILNNQIAVYKSTGQQFYVISFRLDAEGENTGLVTLNQLQNAVRLSADKKDKLCVVNNKIMVLIIKEEQKAVFNLIARVKSNLPGTDELYLKKIMQYISVYAVKVDESIEKSDDIMNELLADSQKEKKKSAII